MAEIVGGWIEGSLPGPDGPVKVDWYPRTDTKPWWDLVADPDLCLHTTEGGTTLGQRYKVWDYPPNFACGDGHIVQLFPLGTASKAVDTKDASLYQIEMAYTVGGKPANTIYLPPPSTLYPVVALVAFLHQRGLIRSGLKRPNPDWPTALDKGPQASDRYYRRLDGTWRKPGVYGHVEIPDDEHWDPGSFDYPKFFPMVQAVLDQGEDEEMFKDWRAGWQAHEDGKALNPDWPSDKKDGWRDRDKVLKDAKA